MSPGVRSRTCSPTTRPPRPQLHRCQGALRGHADVQRQGDTRRCCAGESPAVAAALRALAVCAQEVGPPVPRVQEGVRLPQRATSGRPSAARTRSRPYGGRAEPERGSRTRKRPYGGPRGRVSGGFACVALVGTPHGPEKADFVCVEYPQPRKGSQSRWCATGEQRESPGGLHSMAHRQEGALAKRACGPVGHTMGP